MPVDLLPILCRDCLDGRPRLLIVDYHGDHLLLDAVEDPAVYRVGWLWDDASVTGQQLADAPARVRQWYGTVPATKVWPVKRRRRQAGVDSKLIGSAFARTIIANLPDSRRRAIGALIRAEC